MNEDEQSRLGIELELLRAMYPEQVDYDANSRQLKFGEHSARLQLRLPERYPNANFPAVVAAWNGKHDLRERTMAAIRDAGLIEGEEALDAIIACFQEIVETDSANNEQAETEHARSAVTEPSKTVIIWLHHLLAPSKRKLALSPAAISGITKPGYPGVMVFTGPAAAVADHVDALKAQKWQAFQVRYEAEELWAFAHGPGIKEVETMAEMVRAMETGSNGSRQRREFLKAVGIK